MKRASFRVLAVAVVLAAAPALVDHAAVAGEVHAQTPAPTPSVEVLDAGKAPLEPLRLSPAAGASQRSAMTVAFAIQQSGVSSGSVKPPPTKATVETALQGVTPEGNLQVSFSYPSFEVLKGGEASKSARRRIEQAFAGLAGLSGQLTITPQGVLVDSALNVPPDLDPSVASLVTQLGDQLRTLAVPFPEAAVGVGARWRASTDLSLNGIEANQVYEYTLKKRNGSKIELGVRGTQTAGKQSVELPNVAPGVQLTVQSYKTTFRGQNTVDLTSLLPVAGEIRSSGNQTFHIESGSKSGTLKQHLNVHLVLKPAAR
ncbi:MAG TPA: hypothetical protein VGR04_12020 [Acidimicrobiia bacterium]|nr:hypothetical protein [Acidimicrobiia bacterium]